MSIRPLALSLLLATCPFPAFAQATAKPTAPDSSPDTLSTSASFLSGHPDLRYRLLGLDEYRKGRNADAFRFFLRSAYYADKPSQGMVAEMLWAGQGVAQDRALAYAWMDLAAERGYLTFLGARERYWADLREPERKRAIEEGRSVYSRYGDSSAMPRIAATLRRARAQTTGSRTGFVGSLKIYIPGPGGFEQIDGSKFYDPKYWDPKKYQAWQDSIWMRPRIGQVSVGDVESVEKSNSAGAQSHLPTTPPHSDAADQKDPNSKRSGLGSKPRPCNEVEKCQTKTEPE